MNVAPPIPCEWDGEVFKPQRRFARLVDQHFVIGESYPLEVHEERSSKSHRHYFAAINEAWENLPAPYASQLPTAEHLRKFALIKAGYCDRTSHVCASKAEAQRLRAFVAPLDDFSVIDVQEATVTVYRAKSQSIRAMGRADFQASKDAVLGVLSDILGVTAEELQQHARAA